jgi:hypothetical protein
VILVVKTDSPYITAFQRNRGEELANGNNRVGQFRLLIPRVLHMPYSHSDLRLAILHHSQSDVLLELERLAPQSERGMCVALDRFKADQSGPSLSSAPFWDTILTGDNVRVIVLISS